MFHDVEYTSAGMVYWKVAALWEPPVRLECMAVDKAPHSIEKESLLAGISLSYHLPLVTVTGRQPRRGNLR